MNYQLQSYQSNRYSVSGIAGIIMLGLLLFGCDTPSKNEPVFTFANYSMQFEDSLAVSNCIETVTINSINSNEDTLYVWVGHIGDKVPVKGLGIHAYKEYFFIGSDPITKLDNDSLAIPPGQTVSIHFARSQIGIRDALKKAGFEDSVLFSGNVLAAIK